MYLLENNMCDFLAGLVCVLCRNWIRTREDIDMLTLFLIT